MIYFFNEDSSSMFILVFEINPVVLVFLFQTKAGYVLVYQLQTVGSNKLGGPGKPSTVSRSDVVASDEATDNHSALGGNEVDME